MIPSRKTPGSPEGNPNVSSNLCCLTSCGTARRLEEGARGTDNLSECIETTTAVTTTTAKVTPTAGTAATAQYHKHHIAASPADPARHSLNNRRSEDPKALRPPLSATRSTRLISQPFSPRAFRVLRTTATTCTWALGWRNRKALSHWTGKRARGPRPWCQFL